jgi:hypothetical protein
MAVYWYTVALVVVGFVKGLGLGEGLMVTLMPGALDVHVALRYL